MDAIMQPNPRNFCSALFYLHFLFNKGMGRNPPKIKNIYIVQIA